MNKIQVTRASLRLLRLILVVFVPVCAFAQTTTPTSAPTPVPPVANPYSRFTAGSTIHNPPALYSQNGVLNVQFSYQTTTDSFGRQQFCFMTSDGLENPTLHVNPGDSLNITVTNNTPFNDSDPLEADESFNPPNCCRWLESRTVTANSLARFSETGC
jgi:hypothetical protein